MNVLREGLLEGRRVAIGGDPGAPIARELERLGASVEAVGDLSDDEAATAWARAHAPLHALVFDAGAAFGEGGEPGLRGALDATWAAVRALAAGAMIEDGADGKIVLIAPGPGGTFADAVRAGLENLARTLSVEWARYAITVTAIAPGADTTGAQLGQLVAFLLSRGGDYYSGCRFELGAVIRAS